jgi:hypothetical protein
MWHAIYSQEIQGDSQLLVVGNQIGNLIPGPSFDHNLCFNYPNGSWKPILYIYIPRAFQLYEKLLNPMNFDPYNCSLKIKESIWSLIPKVGAHMEAWGLIPSHSLALPEHEMWLPGSFLAHTFASPYFGHKPKARVTTLKVVQYQ